MPSLPQRKTPKMSSPDFNPSSSTRYSAIGERPESHPRQGCSRLTTGTQSDTLSDMKTFNVRELSRSTAEVLNACEKDGGAIIQYQDGRQFELVPRGKRDAGSRELPDFAARQRAVFGARKFSSAQINASLDAAKGPQ